MTDQDIVEMIFFPIVNEACRVLDEKVVVQSSDLDIATILGMGFPAYRSAIHFRVRSLNPGEQSSWHVVVVAAGKKIFGLISLQRRYRVLG